MTQDDLIEVGEYMRRLEEDSSVRIVFESLNTISGVTYKGTNDKYLMIINTNLSYTAQIETLWHEAKHVYSHTGKKGDITVFEKDADKFAKRCMKCNSEILSMIRAAW